MGARVTVGQRGTGNEQRSGPTVGNEQRLNTARATINQSHSGQTDENRQRAANKQMKHKRAESGGSIHAFIHTYQGASFNHACIPCS